MSELIQKNDDRATIRWKLLTSASALALAITVASSGTANADDTDRPLIWLEVGGQLSRLLDKQEVYSPPFLALEPSQFTSPLKALQAPRYGLDASSDISFQPEDSNWIFSASIRYGRSGSNNHFHQQSYPLPFSEHVAHGGIVLVDPFAAQFIDAKSKNSENHAIVDFQVGRDLGLGLFGHDSSGTLNLGVRIAQFHSKSDASLNEDPDWHFQTKYFGAGASRIQVVHQAYHTFAGEFEADRSFHGVGPSLSWQASTPFAGTVQDGALTLDWGVNASLLFGRQRTRTQHYETEQYHAPSAGLIQKPGVRNTLYHHPATAPAYYSTRMRNITVPNAGGSVGLSWRLQDFKVSLGYRADFFFNAIDGGIDARKDENRAFYGPYASISIGLGD